MGNLLDDRESPTWAFDMAFKLEPGSLSIREALAGRLLELGRVEEAEPHLAAIVKDRPKVARAWIERGMLLAHAGLFERAGADFAAGIDLLKPGSDSNTSRAGVALLLTAEPAAYDRLLALRGNEPALWHVRACQYLRRGEWKRAVADFVRGGEPWVPNEFALAYACALELAGDDAAYNRYVSRQAELAGSSSDVKAVYLLARIAALSPEITVPPRQLMEWALRAVKGNPTAWYYYTQALAAVRTGDMAAAARAVEDSQGMPWTKSRALDDLVLCLIDLRQGRKSQARQRLDRAAKSLSRFPPTAGVGLDPEGKVNLIDWLEFQLLRRELERALYDHEFPADVFAREMGFRDIGTYDHCFQPKSSTRRGERHPNRTHHLGRLLGDQYGQLRANSA